MNYRTELMEQILTSKEAQKIIDYVSPIYGESYVMLWIFQAIGYILDDVDSFPDDFLDQVTPVTATWSVEFWEKEYNIVPESWWSLEQRRENIMATIRYRVPINPKKIEDMVSALLGKEAHVIENVSKNKFIVNVIGYTKKLKRAYAAIDRAKPAHLIYDLVVSDYLNSILNDYYKIIVISQETKSCSVKEFSRDSDGYVRVADESSHIMLDENGSVLIE